MLGFARDDFGGAVPDNEERERHECEREEELQPVDQEDETAVHKLADDAIDAHDECRHRDEEHEGHGDVEHPALAFRRAKKDGDGDEDEGREQLVRRAEERPDAHVAREAQQIAKSERDCRRDVLVAQELRGGAFRLALRRGEKLLEGHASDACDGIDRRHGERRDAHRHDAGGDMLRQAELHEESRDCARENLEGRAVRQMPARRRRADDDEGDDAEQRFDEHCAVADGQHVALVLDGFRACARRNEAVEARDGAAGDRDEEDGEERLPFDLEGDEGGHLDDGIGDEHAEDGARDHAEEQEDTQVVTRLHQEPHGQDGGDEAVGKDDVAPDRRIEIERIRNADGEHGDDERDGDEKLYRARGLHAADEESEAHRHEDVEHRDRSRRRIRYGEAAVLAEAVERVRDDVGEGGDDEQREEPAKQQEETAPRLADVLLDEHAHRAPFVAHRRIERTEILHRAEEDAADKQPEERRKPAEHGGDDGARDGACARDGGKLMRKDGEARGRRVVLPILESLRRRRSGFVNAPRFHEPPSVEGVGSEKDNDGAPDKHQCIHDESFFP